MSRPVGPTRPRQWTRRSMLLALAGAGLAVPACEFGKLFSWNGGKPVLFGYGTASNFDRRYKTIRVKIFRNPTFWSAVPVPGLEEQLTEYLVQQIGQKTPYKVDAGDADTELSGTILSFLQVPINYDQLNEIRSVETMLTCMVVWKDLRTGKILSAPQGRNVEPMPPAGLLPGQMNPLNNPTTLPGSMQTMELSAAPISPAGNAATMNQASPPPTAAANPMLGQTNMPGAAGAPPLASSAMAMGFQGALVRSIAYYRPEIGQSLATAQQNNCNLMAQQIINMMEQAW